MQKKKTLNARIDLLPYGKTSVVSKCPQQHQPHQTQLQHYQHQQQQHQLRPTVFPGMNTSNLCSAITTTITATTAAATTTSSSSLTSTSRPAVAASKSVAVNFNLPLISKHQLYNNIENSDNGEQTKLQFIDYDEI